MISLCLNLYISDFEKVWASFLIFIYLLTFELPNHIFFVYFSIVVAAILLSIYKCHMIFSKYYSFVCLRHGLFSSTFSSVKYVHGIQLWMEIFHCNTTQLIMYISYDFYFCKKFWYLSYIFSNLFFIEINIKHYISFTATLYFYVFLKLGYIFEVLVSSFTNIYIYICIYIFLYFY